MAVDFLHVDTVLLKRLYVLVFIEHGAPSCRNSRCTTTPPGRTGTSPSASPTASTTLRASLWQNSTLAKSAENLWVPKTYATRRYS